MTKTKLIGGFVAAAALLAPALAAAQDDFEPLGMRAGAFLVYPSVRLGTAYDDNVFATDDDEDDDFIFTVRPEVRAELQWSQHSLFATAFSELGFYESETDSNYQDFGGALGGTLDVRRNSRSDGRLAIARLHDDRDDPDDARVSDVTQFYRYDAELGHRHTFNRLFVEPTAFGRRYDYESAGDVSNTERDYNNFGLGLRVGVIMSPRINLFTQVNGDIVRYDEGEPRNEDSDGYDLLGGVEIDLNRLLVGEVSMGYGERDYDGDFNDTNGLAGNLALTWTPTQLTTVRFLGSSGIEESNVVYEGDRASGALNYQFGTRVTHDLRRNIQLNASAQFDRDEFEGTGRNDDTYRFGGGITYLLNRRLSVDATYDFSKRESDADRAEFTRNIFRIGLTARL